MTKYICIVCTVTTQKDRAITVTSSLWDEVTRKLRLSLGLEVVFSLCKGLAF